MKKFIPLLLAAFVGCNKHDQPDSVKLDSIISNTQIDRIEFVSPGTTNSVAGLEAKKLWVLLQRTNRITGSDSTKDQVQFVRFLSGSNEMLGLTLTEGGLWKFGNYSFRLQNSP